MHQVEVSGSSHPLTRLFRYSMVLKVYMMVLSVCFIHTKPLAHYPDIDFKQIEWIALQNSPWVPSLWPSDWNLAICPNVWTQNGLVESHPKNWAHCMIFILKLQLTNFTLESCSFTRSWPNCIILFSSIFYVEIHQVFLICSNSVAYRYHHPAYIIGPSTYSWDLCEE